MDVCRVGNGRLVPNFSTIVPRTMFVQGFKEKKYHQKGHILRGTPGIHIAMINFLLLIFSLYIYNIYLPLFEAMVTFTGVVKCG